MQRVCFLLQVRKNHLSGYLAAHYVWPEMLGAIQEAGISNYLLFCSEEGLVVGYFEAEDSKASLRRLGETHINSCWQEYVAEYFEGGSGDLECLSASFPSTDRGCSRGKNGDSSA